MSSLTGVVKAPLDRPKLSMPGGYPGGCVRLWRGASGKSWGAMPEGETLLAGEGLLATAVWLRFLHAPRERNRLTFEVEPARCAVSLRF